MTTRRYRLLEWDSVPAILPIFKEVGISKSGVYFLISEGQLTVERRGPRSTLVERQSVIEALRRRGAIIEINGDDLVITEDDEGQKSA